VRDAVEITGPLGWIEGQVRRLLQNNFNTDFNEILRKIDFREAIMN